MARFAIIASRGEKERRAPNAVDSVCGARENEQTRSGRTVPFGRKPERNYIV
jgi:hypothetical protein